MTGMNLQFMAVGLLGLIVTALGAVMFFFGMLPQEAADIFKAWALPFFLIGLVGMTPAILTKFFNPLIRKQAVLIRLEDGGFRSFKLFSDLDSMFTPGNYGSDLCCINDFEQFEKDLRAVVYRTQVQREPQRRRPLGTVKPFVFIVVPEGTAMDVAEKIFFCLWDQKFSVAAFMNDCEETKENEYFEEMAKSEEIKQFLNW